MLPEQIAVTMLVADALDTLGVLYAVVPVGRRDIGSPVARRAGRHQGARPAPRPGVSAPYGC
jgi:hypothetical protein